MSVNVFYFSGSSFPNPGSFGFGINSGWLAGDLEGGLWNIQSNSFTSISIPISPYQYSVNTYIYSTGTNLLVSNAGYGLLQLSNSSFAVTGYPIAYPLLTSCFENASGNYAINIYGVAFYQDGTPINSGVGGGGGNTLVTYASSSLTTGTATDVLWSAASALVTGSGGSNVTVNASGTLFANQGVGPIGPPFWGANSQEQSNTFYSYMGLSGFGDIIFQGTYSVTGGVTGNVSGLWKSACASYLPASSCVLIAGWSPTIFSPLTNAICINASTPAVLLGFSPGLSGGSIQAWGSPSGTAPSGLWSYVNALSGVGLGASVAAAFASLTGALAIDATSGLFRGISYIGGTITQTQTGTLTGVGPYIGIIGNNIALASQTSTSSVIAITYSGTTWTVSGKALSGITNPAAIRTNGINAGIGFASGLSIITYSSSWSLVSSVSLPFQPTAITLDTSGNYFCVGFGQAALVSPSGTLLGSGLFDSNKPFINGVSYYNSQFWAVSSGYIIPLSYQSWQPSGSSILSPNGAFIVSANSYLNNNGSSWAINTGSPNLSGSIWAAFQGSLLVPSSFGIIELEMTAPFALEYRRAGASVLYSGGAYTNFSGYGLGNEPSSIGLDASGNPRIITIQGNMLTIGSGNSISASASIWTQGGGLLGILPDSNGNMWGIPTLAPALIETS